MKKLCTICIAVLLSLLMTAVLVPTSAYAETAEMNLSEDGGNPYQDVVAAIDAKKPAVQRQMRIHQGGKEWGICSVCSMVTLLNRRLKADDKSGSFNAKDVVIACGGKDVRVSGTDVYTSGGYSSVWYNRTYKKNGVSYTAQIIRTKTVKSVAKSKTAFYQYLALLLHFHPEGIALRCKYTKGSSGHVLVVTKYAMEKGKLQLYVYDPAKNKVNMKIEDSHLYKKCGKENMYKYADFISVLKGSKAITPFANPTVLNVGESRSLIPLFSTAAIGGKYSSSDPGICTVDNNGTVTGISKGEATITATILSLTCKAYVRVEGATEINGTIRFNEGEVQYKGATPYVIWNYDRHEPGFTVLDDAGEVIDPANYDYEYRENRQAGTGYVFVTFKNAYSGSCNAFFKIYLPATTETTVENVEDGVKLTWSPVEDAAGYVIYRRAWNLVDAGWTDFVRWNNTTDCEWTDTNVYAGTRYQYGIKAYFDRRTDPVSGVEIGGNVGDNFNLGMVGPLQTTVRITTRKLTKLTPGTQQATAKWEGSKLFTGYQLQIARNSGFSKNVRTIKIADAATYIKVIDSLETGIQYYVRIRSYHIFDGTTYYGQWSNVKNCTVK